MTTPTGGRVLLAVALLLCVSTTALVSARRQPTGRHVSYERRVHDDCIKLVPPPAYCCGKSALFPTGNCPGAGGAGEGAGAGAGEGEGAPAAPRAGGQTAAADHAH